MLIIEADFDPSLPSRILDLFAAQNRLPTKFNFDASNADLRVRVDVGDLPAPTAAVLVARIRRIPGVRSAQGDASLQVDR